MLERLAGLESEYEAVVHRLSDPVVQSDPKLLREAGKRLKDLEPLVQTYQSYRSSVGDLAVAREMFADAEGASMTSVSSFISPSAYSRRPCRCSDPAPLMTSASCRASVSTWASSSCCRSSAKFGGVLGPPTPFCQTNDTSRLPQVRGETRR